MVKHTRHLPLLILLFAASVSWTQELSGEDMRSLDGQVQEIKSDVLDISAELNLLEERLLYPSNTQVAVFVELAEGYEPRLDAVQININGELATHHIYSFKELEALQKGGVQRVYTGNIPTGTHEISVVAMGKRSNGDDFESAHSFGFSKGVTPKSLGVRLAGATAISVEEW